MVDFQLGIIWELKETVLIMKTKCYVYFWHACVFMQEKYPSTKVTTLNISCNALPCKPAWREED